MLRLPLLATIALCAFVAAASAQSTVFTYQGKLVNAGSPANGNYDFQFALYDAASNGTQLGSTIQQPNVPVSGGIFTVNLDFGNQFTGADRYVEISVRPSGGGAFTTLLPRQLITSSPHSIRSISSGNADALSASCNQCITNAQIQSVDGGKLTGTINGGSISAGTVTETQLANGIVSVQQRNASLLASQRWDLLKPLKNVATGGNQTSQCAFDGTNIWVANSTGATGLAKIRASDATLVGQYSYPQVHGVTFDGTNIWITVGNNLLKLQPTDGSTIATYNLGNVPTALTFDGTSVWAITIANNSVVQVRPSDGSVLGTYQVGSHPQYMAFDGAYLWVTNASSNNVTIITPQNQDTLGTPVATGSNPMQIVFDGSNMWVANSGVGANSVTKIRAADGTVLATYNHGAGVAGVGFDGVNIWVILGSGVKKVRASDGAVLASFPDVFGFYPVFDGSNLWVVDGTAARLPSFP